jgi:predicted porin
MKKQLLALAVAGAFAVPAMAQVTISGVIDARALVAEKVSSNTTDPATTGNVKTQGVGNGVATDGFATSQLVFTASEDLGGGLRATAYFAQRLTNTLGERDRYLDLTGGFGGIRVGRFNPTFTSNWNTLTGLGTTGNAGSHYQFITTGQLTAAGTATNLMARSAFSVGTFERQDSGLQYTSPNMSGFVAAAGLFNASLDTTGTSTAFSNKVKSQQYYATLNYTAGPLAVGAGFAQKKTGTESATFVNNKGKANWLGASYDLKVVRLHATYTTRDDKTTNSTGVTTTNNDANLITLAASMPLGATTLRLSIYDGKDKAGNGAADDGKLKGYQLSAVYDLSRRTSLYAVIGQNKYTANQLGSTVATGSRKYDGYSLGLRHTF